MRVFRLPFAVLLTTFVVTMGLAVQTTAPAAALTIPPIIKIGLSKAVPVTKGFSMGLRVTNPAGMAITAAQLSWMAYSNRDTLMDFVNGPNTPTDMEAWEKLDESCAAPGAENLPECQPDSDANGWTTAGTGGGISGKITSVTGTQVQMELICTARWYRSATNTTYCGTNLTDNVREYRTNNSNVAPQYQAATRSTCRKANGTTVDRRGNDWTAPGNMIGFGKYTFPNMTGNVGDAGPWTVVKAFQVCDTGETPIGLTIAPRLPNNYAQTFGISWGTHVGVPLPTGDVTFDQAKVTNRCKNAETGETQNLVTTSDLRGDGTVVIPSCKQHLGDDWYSTGTTIAPEKPRIDGEPVEDDPVWDVPDFPPLEWDELIPDKDDADWQPCYGTKTGCLLDVWIDNEPCVMGSTKCKTWTRVQERDPDRVKCMFGVKEVAMNYCRPSLQSKYDTEVQTDTAVGTPTVPETGTGTQPPPTTTTGPPRPVDPADAPQQAQCFPKGWGLLNPFEWVYKPVKCVLEWAFVPPTSFATRMGRMKAAMESKPPFSWFISLTALPAAIPGGGCPDWRVHVGSVDRNIICGTGMGNAMRAARPVFTALMLGAAFWPMLRSVMYASFPLVKPTPVSS